jgi:exoribonuclease-2
MKDAGFDPFFPEAVRDQVRSLQNHPPLTQSNSQIKDLRSILWSSVDNVDTEDFDQLEFAQVESDGALHVLVAIADVDSHVPKGCPIDDFARDQTTSIYTGVATFPMLPLELSTDMTSLREDADRLAMVADLTVDGDGALKSTDVYPALVRNKAHLDYDSLGDWLDNGSPAPPALARSQELTDQIRLQNKEARQLDEMRHRNGALDFETIEANPVLVDGTVTDLTVPKVNSARELIENFMIAANQGINDFLQARGFPCMQRVVREPERWPKIVQVAEDYGAQLPGQPDPHALSTFLAARKAADPDHFPDLSLTIIKLLGPGEYVAIPPRGLSEEHFGLAVRGYVHSTAPNRRYPDLVTQRLLKAAIAGKPTPYSLEELNVIAQHCNERADAARKVERLMRKVAAATMLSHRIGQVFPGIVTGANFSGTYVRLLAPPAEGRVLQGEQGMDVGDRVTVRLIGVDPYKGFIDFARAH